jgi:hypothetical protein
MIHGPTISSYRPSTQISFSTDTPLPAKTILNEVINTIIWVHTMLIAEVYGTLESNSVSNDK